MKSRKPNIYNKENKMYLLFSVQDRNLGIKRPALKRRGKSMNTLILVQTRSSRSLNEVKLIRSERCVKLNLFEQAIKVELNLSTSCQYLNWP